MITPSAIIEEWDKFKRLLRQRPWLTAIVSLSLLVALLYTARVIRTDMWITGSPKLVILVPEDGASVESDQQIRGVGATQRDFFYPVVTSRQTGGVFIAGERISVAADGSWEGSARFGDTATLAGARFQLQIVQSRAYLPEGSLVAQSSNLRFSKGLEVVRR